MGESRKPVVASIRRWSGEIFCGFSGFGRDGGFYSVVISRVVPVIMDGAPEPYESGDAVVPAGTLADALAQSIGVMSVIVRPCPVDMKTPYRRLTTAEIGKWIEEVRRYGLFADDQTRQRGAGDSTADSATEPESDCDYEG